MKEALTKDDGSINWDAMDGYDELTDEDEKAKVRKAVEQGHVDDEDWKGVRILP